MQNKSLILRVRRLARTSLLRAESKARRVLQRSRDPIFIVGCGHSGTSLALAVLGAHSRVHAIPRETGFALGSSPEKSLQEFAQEAQAAGKKCWVEKTPKHIRCIEKLLELRPQAHVILMLRDGRDVACSIQDRTGSLEQGIQRWVDDNAAGRPYWDHPQVHLLRYEELVNDFEGTIRRTLGFLGLKYEEQLSSYHKTPKQYYSKDLDKPESAFGKDHEQYRNWQINQPLFDGRGKWERMSEEELARVQSIGGKMLSLLNY